MNKSLAAILRSPETGNSLRLETFLSQGDEVIEGRLIDSETGTWFRIENGIVDLKPLALRSQARYEAFRSRFGISEEGSAHLGSGDRTYEADQQKQIAFFDGRPEEYLQEVVESPYYVVLDSVTFLSWAKRTLAPGGRVLEIGCGPGRQTVPLAKLGLQSVALDLSEELLRIARRKLSAAGLADRANLVASSAEILPIADSTFDACVIYGSLHHFANPAIVLAKAASALRSGGHFYMLEPHKSPVRFIFEWLMRLRPLWQEEASNDPLFKEEQFRAWLSSNGIKTKIKISTYLPPHVFYAVGRETGERVLRWTDRLFSSIPGIRKLGGLLIAEGVKE